jgi:glycosyltransferase involved in cell wall biosynthesis
VIAYIQYTNPACYPPLQHSSIMFANSGMKVLFLGTGSGGQSNSFEFPYHENIKVKRWNFCKAGWKQKFHYAAFCLWSSFTAWWSGAKWVYASDPFSCPAALIAQRVLGIKIVYHEHDSPNSNSLQKSFFDKCQLFFRKIIGRSANIVVFPNEARANLFRDDTCRTAPIEIVWNVPSREEIELCKNTKPANPILFYHGSLNEKRLPVSVLDALMLLDSNVELVFAGYTAGLSYNYGEWYLSEAKKRLLDKRVKFLGAIIDRGSLLAECSKASIGLAFMPSISNDINMKHMTGASNKPFDYLACGLNLIVSDLPDWMRFYVHPKLAVSCNPENPKSIANAVNQIIQNDIQNNVCEEKIKALLHNEWNYESQFEKVYDRVAE